MKEKLELYEAFDIEEEEVKSHKYYYPKKILTFGNYQDIKFILTLKIIISLIVLSPILLLIYIFFIKFFNKKNIINNNMECHSNNINNEAKSILDNGFNNNCNYNYSFKAEYYTLVDNQKIFLLRNNFEILEMVIDGQKVEPSLEYNFPLKGYHIVHILLNNSNNINSLHGMFSGITHEINIFFSII